MKRRSEASLSIWANLEKSWILVFTILRPVAKCVCDVTAAIQRLRGQ